MGRFRLSSLPPLPGPLRAIPAPAAALIGLLIAVNVLVWAGVGIVLHFYPKLIGTAALAYSLGLRHALDADHISAIDLTTRRLIAAGQRPVAVGTFFSLGHSTIVIITCIVVAATSGALQARFDSFRRVGGIVGTSVSAAFLLLLCVGNGWVLWRLSRRLKVALAEQRARTAAAADVGELEADDGGAGSAAGLREIEGVGFLAIVFRGLFKTIDRPWKMYPLGIVFGLGFDTSSEVALLGIASIEALDGTSLWVILILPILFTGRSF